MAVAVGAAIFATLVGLALEAVPADTRWPWGLHLIQDYPFWSLLAITLLVAGVTLARLWWQQRLELADDTGGSDGAIQVFTPVTPPPVQAVFTGPVTINQPLSLPAGLGSGSNLPSRNPAFTGRDEVFVRLAAGLGQGPVAVVAVAGMGGLGKTQIALEWAHRGLQSGRYRLVWWVRAESPVTMAEDLAALAPELGVQMAADQAQVVAQVRAALSELDGWLIVFDNAPDAASVRPWLPSGRGHAVVTSRDRKWTGVANALEIEVFDRAESVEFLRSSTGESGPQLDELAGVLGDLPLALAQAAAYMQGHGGLSVRRFLQVYRDQVGAGRLLAAGVPGYPDSVATTWLIHYTALEQGSPAGLELLRLLAFVDPDEINVGLLMSRPELLGGELERACDSGVGVEETVGQLIGSGLLSRVDDEHVRMHRLVGAVTRHQLGDAAAEWAERVMGLLAGLLPKRPWEHETWPVSAQLASHVAAAEEYAPPVEVTADALMGLGIYLRERAEYAPAVGVIGRALAIYEQMYGSDHRYVAYALGHLGTTQRQQGDLEAARESQERALAINEAAYGLDHPEVAIALVNLGIVQELQGDLEAARGSQERALAINKDVYGPDHPEVAITLGNLGGVQRLLGDLEAARESQERALAIEEAVYGTSHPEVARTLTNLGNVQQLQGDLVAARQSQERALAINEAVYGPDHPEVALTLNNLGVVLEDMGESAAARACWERSLVIRRAKLGDAHPHTKTTVDNLAGLIDEHG